ncbi:MAG: DNA-protecting protein DprA [Bacteroidia bacterium]|nr:DNA-protecting protein DprA [Bacteroidia bacterium]
MDNTLKYKIAVTLIPGIGCILAKKLIAYVGSVEGIFSEKERNLIKIPGIGEYLAREIANQNVLKRAEEELGFIEKKGITTLFYLDKDYPERLKHCNDAPVMLFVKGGVNFNHPKVISIVGTRNATRYGKEICKDFISEIANRNHDVIIVSGLAFGIDVSAHRAALENGLQTIAVLGHGLDIIYPAAHETVARKILDQGALVTEFLNNSSFDKQNFVKRNRIIAGISDATIVVESSEKGGALITAEIANSYNRDVFAFPGKINDKYSLGCNKLIKSNKAALIESVNDLEYILGWDTKSDKKDLQQVIPFITLSDDENNIFRLLKDSGEMNIDSISYQLDIPVNTLSALLLNLEFSGLIKSLPGKVYTPA